MKSWEQLEEKDYRAFWDVGNRFARLDRLEGDLLSDYGVLRANFLFGRPAEEVAKVRRWRKIGAAVVGSLVLAGGLVAGVAALVDGPRSTSMPAQFQKLSPFTLRPLLQNKEALAATGTCGPVLRAQAELERRYQEQVGREAIPSGHHDRPKIFADAAVLAEQEMIPCVPTNKKGEYIYKPNPTARMPITITRSDIVRFDASGSKWWCEERERLKVQLDQPRHPDSQDPVPTYWREELAIGDALLHDLGYSCQSA